MEVRRANTVWAKRLLLCMAWLLVCFTNRLHAQTTKNYAIKDGKMYITLGKNLLKASLDSFINKYELFDLDLRTLISSGSSDSLKKHGWQVVVNTPEVYVISKPLLGADNVINPADKIIFTQSADVFHGDQVNFGFNRFKNKPAFTGSDSVVSFFLRGNTNARKVILTGSFFNWDPKGISMTPTDSGWLASVKLGAGKHWYKFITDGNWILDKDNSNRENDGMGNDNSVYYKTNYTFKLDGFTNAKRVYVAGSFNNWNEKQLQMQRTAGGWTIPVFLANGTYTYRFIVDGNWMEDPGNPDKFPNEFHEYNSVIRLGKPYLFKLDGYTQAKEVTVMGSFNGWKQGELLMKRTATGWELPYVLGSGTYAYHFTIDGKDLRSAKGQDIPLVIDPNYTFRLQGYPNARNVYLAGDMNGWNETSFKMQREGADWVLPVHLGKGKQRYKFIVDGNWILDPANKLWEQNEHQTGNSVLWIDKE